MSADPEPVGRGARGTGRPASSGARPGTAWLRGERHPSTGRLVACRSASVMAPGLSHFSVEVRREHRAAIVVPSGELDLVSAPELRAQLEHAWKSGAEQVIVDLREVPFLDSTGLHVIVGAHQHAQEPGLAF